MPCSGSAREAFRFSPRKENWPATQTFGRRTVSPPGLAFLARSTIMNWDNRKRIILIDDHLLLRQGLERMLNSGDEFVVCEETGSAAEGIEMVRDLRPDGVIIDVGLPGADGIELTRELLDEFPNLVVLILSAREEPEYIARAREAGAMGYIVKSAAIETLHLALRNAFNGKRTFSDEANSQRDPRTAGVSSSRDI